MNSTTGASLVDLVKSIAREFAGPAADSVDREARFPVEAITALKKANLMSAFVPTSLGGGGATLTEVVQMCEALSVQCTSTAMIFAMHQIQIACIVRHAQSSSYFQSFLKDLLIHQYLVASVTSEVGVSGEMRKSVCGVEVNGDRFALNKDATTISYGGYADYLLVTARRNPTAPASDQSLVLISKSDYKLEQKGVWDTMGMRGTCSPPFRMESTGKITQIMETPFSEISSQTMVPFSHLLWAGVWMGTASAAVGKARMFVQTQARQSPGKTPPTALRFAELSSQLHTLRSSIHNVLKEYEAIIANEATAADELSSLSFALKINHMKISATQLLPQIIQGALIVCGIMGYKNDSKFAMGRHLRDSLSGALMVSNDRILAGNAAMLLVHKDQ